MSKKTGGALRRAVAWRSHRGSPNRGFSSRSCARARWSATAPSWRRQPRVSREPVIACVVPLLRAMPLAVLGTRDEARRVRVFGGGGPPRRRVCHDRGPRRIGGPCVSRGAQAGGVRPLPPPATRRCRGAVRPYAVPRRTRRRGDAVRRAAGPAAWGRRRAGTACACCAR